MIGRPSTLAGAAVPRRRSLKVAALVLLAVATACGKKGPPLAPFVRVPAQVAAVTSQRIGSDVYLTFPVPSANADGQQPADIAAVEVYAITSTRPPATEEQREQASLVTTLPVRPIPPELPVPANGTPPPPLPVPPGVDRGATAVVRETLTPESRVPVELPVEPGSGNRGPGTATGAGLAGEVEAFVGPLVAPALLDLPRRHYFVVGVSPRGRKSDPSVPISVPLDAGSSAPGTPRVTYTETAMTITWPPPADARTSTVARPVAANTSPSATVALPPLTARSLGFTTEATLYHVYEVPPVDPAPDPFGLAVPAPLTPVPIAATEHVIAGVTFATERCFEVRPVDQVSGAQVIGPASPRACVTAVDTFPPAAPRSLAVIAGAGVISLIWEANAEKDLAGYHVLRGEAPGDTLRAITAEPVAATTYRDGTVRPGTRYVYAVVAVDRANNQSAPSNRQEETARQ